MCDGEWFSIVPGSILIYAGYAWDGASGPTIDSENSMAASLVHDAFYQAIRTGQVPGSFRRRADGIFRDILKEDGMSFARRWLWYFGVRLFGGKYGTDKLTLLAQ